MMKVNERNITGKKIKSIRLCKKITQEQLAARLHVQGLNMDRTNISRIERQSRELYDYEVKAIANALNVNIDDLFK